MGKEMKFPGAGLCIGIGSGPRLTPGGAGRQSYADQFLIAFVVPQAIAFEF